MPLVSWIICSNKVTNYLKLAIESCFNQSFSDFEIIFIANGKNSILVYDKVMEWFGHQKDFHAYTTDIEFLTFSLNLGIHFSKGKYIARMDDDDISVYHRLEKQVNFLEENPEIDIVGSCYITIDEHGKDVEKIDLPLTHQKIVAKLFRANPFCHPSIMFRRKSVSCIGGYLGGIYAQDYDLWVRMLVGNNLVSANMSEYLVKYRVFSNAGARNSRTAYSIVAGRQLSQFLIHKDFRWLLASIITSFKSIIKSKRK